MNSTQRASERLKEMLEEFDLPWYKWISRPIGVLITAVLSILITWWLYVSSFQQQLSEQTQTLLLIPTVALALIASPIAFALWCFRNADKTADIENARQALENARRDTTLRDENARKDSEQREIAARRDTNLKAFQQVQEWVSGKHFKRASPTETERALQVSAVHQLGEFFQGVYDDSFRRPAFEMLKALWKIELDQALKQYPQPESKADAKVERYAWSEWREALRKQMQTPLARALAVSVFGQAAKGLHHESIKDIVAGTYWSGLDASLPDLGGKTLNLSKLNLQKVTLSGAQLADANLQGADLWAANLQGADLKWANLQGADLNNIKFNEKTSFMNVQVNEQTRIGFWKQWRNPDSFDRDKTNQLRELLELTPLAANEMPTPPWVIIRRSTKPS